MRAFDLRTSGVGEREALVQLSALRSRARETSEEAVAQELARLTPAFPLKIQIQTTTRCNAACAMCPYPEITEEAGFNHEQMSEETYREILRQLVGRGVERLSLFLMNEPLIDKRMPSFIALAREALPDVRIGIFSNGSALTPQLTQKLADAGLDELCVSVHGFDPQTYESVMKGLSFERVSQAVASVLTELDRGAYGKLHMQLVSGDLPEQQASLKQAPPLLAKHTLLKGFSNERAAAEVAVGLPSSRLREGDAALCQRPFVKLYVLTTGDVVLCNVDWRRTVILGRIGPEPENQIEAIWHGERYRAVRMAHLQRRFEGARICERCDYPAIIEGE